MSCFDGLRSTARDQRLPNAFFCSLMALLRALHWWTESWSNNVFVGMGKSEAERFTDSYDKLTDS